MNMVAEKFWNKNFYAWRFGFGFNKINLTTTGSCSDPIKNVYIKMNLF
jgi:hypothetical protein